MYGSGRGEKEKIISNPYLSALLALHCGHKFTSAIRKGSGAHLWQNLYRHDAPHHVS
jgi:hypothetical protein